MSNGTTVTIGANTVARRFSAIANLFLDLRVIILFVLVTGFAIRVFRLNFYSLWYDEATTAMLLQSKTVGNAVKTIVATTGSETLHPLYYLVLSAWTQVAGHSEFALRFPSVVFGTLAIAVYTALLYYFGRSKTAVFGLLLIFCPFLMWYSRDARPYALIIFVSALHLLSYIKLITNSVSKVVLAGFVVTGVLLVYSGILTGIILMAELLHSLLFRRRVIEVICIGLAVLLCLPLLVHGLRTHFVNSSGRHRTLPTGMDIIRAVAMPQEFVVGRSLGPTPDQVRRMPIKQLLADKAPQIIFEGAALLSIAVSLGASIIYMTKSQRFFEKAESVRAVGYVAVISVVMVLLLILLVNYKMNARHVAFLFGHLFVLAVLPVAAAEKRWVKVAFVLPLLMLWGWSSANQLFVKSYCGEDYRGAAQIIVNSDYQNSTVLALCHPFALGYYGAKGIKHIPESTDVTLETIAKFVENDVLPAWVVIARPWNYPGFNANELKNRLNLVEEKHLTGVDLFLVSHRKGQ